MHYVYILRSVSRPRQTYVGLTQDLKARLAQHNAGKSRHTAKFTPWTLAAYVAVPDRVLGERLEKYLKSGSGHAFTRRHLLNPTVG
jgi:predicted GIY-YIG superfamily endonuclease